MVFVIIPVGLIASLFRCMSREREEPEYQVVQPATTQVVCVTHRSRQQQHCPQQPQHQQQPQQQYVPQSRVIYQQQQPQTQCRQPPSQPPQQQYAPQSRVIYQQQPPQTQQYRQPPSQPPQYHQSPQTARQPATAPNTNPTVLAGRPQRRKFFQKRDKNGYVYAQLDNN